MKLNKEEVAKIATLGALALTEEESERMQSNLSKILDYVELLSRVATKGVKETSHVHGAVNAFRDDIVRESLSIDEVKENAPDFVQGGFRVPRIL